MDRKYTILESRNSAKFSDMSVEEKRVYLLEEISMTLAIISDNLDGNLYKIIDINGGILGNTYSDPTF